jgi:5'-3' exonuclease
MLCIPKHNEIVFFDISYILFLKYHATLKWFKFSDTEVTIDTFIPKYEKGIYKLFELLNKFNFPVSKTKWCFAKDTPRRKIWRNSMHDSYKGTRVSNDDNMVLRAAFERFWNVIYPKIEEDFNISLIYYDTAEADDVIAASVKYISQTLNSKVSLHVITKDHDLVQLCNMGATVSSIKINGNKSPSLLDLRSSYDQLLLENFSTYKCLIGDSSDNISGVSKAYLDPKHKSPRSIGPKTARQIIEGKYSLTYILDRNEKVHDTFMRNKKLMDFNEIPQYLTDGIIAELSKVLCLQRKKGNK